MGISVIPVVPFIIDIPEPSLDALGARLVRTRWPDEVHGAAWDYTLTSRI